MMIIMIVEDLLAQSVRGLAKQVAYIHIYIYIYMHMFVYIYIYIVYNIYIYIYNRHLGLINAPPLCCLFLQTAFFTLHLLSKRPEMYKILAKTLLIIFPPSWGDTFARINYWTFT